MKSDTEVRHEGVKALMQVLGMVDAERFITLINREQFDYTEWRKTQWLDETVTSLAEQARVLRNRRV